MPHRGGMNDMEYLAELHAIYRMKAIRDHAVDQKDWDTYAALHTDDYMAMSIGAEPIVGGRGAAAQLAMQLAGVTTVHHCHTPVIEGSFIDRAFDTVRGFPLVDAPPLPDQSVLDEIIAATAQAPG